jgi:protease I
MAGALAGKRVAILAADGVERVELEQPRQALDPAGARTEVLSIHDGEIQAGNNDLESAGTFQVNRLVADASVGDYDDLPAFCIRIVEEFARMRQPVGATGGTS